MQKEIDAVIKMLLKRINDSVHVDEKLTIAQVISKLADAKQTLFVIGETKNQKNLNND